MRSSRTLLPVAALVCCSWSSLALAAPPGPGAQPLQVLELATDDYDDQAKAFTLALRARVKASKDQSLLPGDFALGVLLVQLKCGDVPDPTCQLAIADKIKAERFIWGTMRKADGKQIAIDIHLWQRGQNEIRQQINIPDDLKVAEDANLQKYADQVLTKLTTFGKNGTVKLSAPRAISGDLFVDGQGQGKFSGTAGEVSLPQGDHQFEVRADGKVVAQGSGRVSAGVPIDLELTIVGGGEGGGQGPTTTSKAAWKLPASYAAMGVGGVMVLAAGYMSVWAATNGLGDDGIKNFLPYAYKSARTQPTASDEVKGDTCTMAKVGESRHGITGASASPDIIAAAKKTCERSDTFKTAQFVLYPLGALLVGGGAYLYMTSKKGGGETTGSKRRIEVSPMVGTNSGFVDVRLTF